ncbi:MAG: putative peptidoglycan glycosyltransferase FtsW [Anaerolineae bacterium]|nr:putative peptidoglycan glycosyltransferase FtsW [Anaerolineae bacterium]MDK1080547.1 putative peptidoglycan glycosyltransferase FtsW [Anaerolineae bacterium]MDK1117422.1 putative peptidoglycan glycosyltransferase FtsW [Anaerolineae bacterium]
MGTGTFVTNNNNRVLSRSSKAARPSRGSDIPLLLTVFALLVFGLIMLYSASWDFSLDAFDNPVQMFNRQMLWMAIGIAVAFFLSRLDYHHWRKLILIVMALTIILLISVLMFSEIRFDTKRSFFDGSVQPSELAKLVLIIYLSVWLYSKRQSLQDVQFGLIPLGMILGIIGGLIYLQPDISAAGTVLILGGLLFFLAGGDLKQITLLMFIALIGGWLVVQFSATGQERVTDFVTGIQDPTKASYHVRRSFEAIVNGGVFGTGIGRSETKLLGLPVPPTDSIFAVITEELGLVGSTILILLYSAFVWRGMTIARRAPDMFGTLLASSMTLWIALEALINMSVMVGLMPFAGNALPFISAGGSNLVVSLAAIGILLNISKHTSRSENSENDWRSFGAVVDLRWRNRRRRVSRSGRS